MRYDVAHATYETKMIQYWREKYETAAEELRQLKKLMRETLTDTAFQLKSKLDVTPMSSQMLAWMYVYYPRVLTRDHIETLRQIIPSNYSKVSYTESKSSEVQICRIRKAIHNAGGNREYIQTMAGYGYSLTSDGMKFLSSLTGGDHD